MLPIDYVPLESREVEAIQHWFASGAYPLVCECLEAKMAQATESALKAMCDVTLTDEARNERMSHSIKESLTIKAALDLLETLAQGFHGEDESNKFEYLRMTAKLK